MRMRPLAPVVVVAVTILSCSSGSLRESRGASRATTARVAIAALAATTESLPPGTFTVEDVATGTALRAALRGLGDVTPEARADGAVIYRAAYAGGDVVIEPMPDGAKDAVHFPAAPANAAVEYDVTLVSGAEGLRLVADTLEVLDARGAPRLRVGAPIVVGADGVQTAATVTLSGCAADTSPLPPWDRPVTAPGATACVLRVSWEGQAVAYPAVLDPFWTAVALDMPASKAGHAAAPWAQSTNVAVLIGGANNGGPVKSSFWCHLDGTCATGPQMANERQYATATVISGGRVLVAGGYQRIRQDLVPTQSVEILGANGSFSNAAPLGTPRAMHAATLLANGKVLVCGGFINSSGGSTASCETYDPGTNAWAPAASLGGLGEGRAQLSLTTLTDGRVVAAGGLQGTTVLSTTSVYDGTSWTSAGAMAHPRAGHGAVFLPGGKLLVAGGASTATVELGDGTAWTSGWNLAAGATGVRGTTATVLDSGRVLVVGGGAPSVCDPAAASCASIATTTAIAHSLDRVDHTATLLGAGPNRRVLVAGGTIAGEANPTATALLFTDTLPLGAACSASAECESGSCVDGVCCDGGCGPCGRCDVAGSLGQCVAVTTPRPGACTKDDPACGTGGCDGQSIACRYPGTEVTCRDAQCTSDGHSVVAATSCDGSGTCPPAPAPTPCQLYVCSASACLASCSSDLQCIDPAQSCTTASSTVPAGRCVSEAPPVLTVPATLYPEATRPSGADVAFASQVSATDEVDGSVTPVCVPPSGSAFPLDAATGVTCTATDHRGHAATGTFTVQVRDTTAPTFPAPPTDQTKEAETLLVPPFGPGATFTWATPVAEDTVGVSSVICTPASPVTVSGVTQRAISCTATDTSGNVRSVQFNLAVVDTTPPLLSLPTLAPVEATGPSGAAVTFEASATDIVDGSVPVTCEPASGATFPLGATVVSCSATDAHHNPQAGTFTVTVRDTTPPVVTVAPDVVAEATGPSGAAVGYAAPTATDLVDGVVAASCDHASGATFPLGVTTVTCSATDAHSNTGHATFKVTVQDTTPPVVTASANLVAEATGPGGAAETYAAPTATDLVDGVVAASCDHPSGAMFPLGVTTVTCSATDAHSNTGHASFTITVRDTTPPVVTVSSNRVAEATGPAGAAVTYAAPTAADLVDGAVGASCDHASGATFPLGVTSVACSATDAHGNTGHASFTVTVEDTTAPALTLPPPIHAEATGAAGAAVTFTATAADLVDGAVTPVCSAASGATFAIGTTTVTCTATDAHGNVASGSFTITVSDTTPPAVTPPADVAAYATSTAGAIVNYSGASATDIVDGSVATTCLAASGSQFPLGATVVTCSATDAHGNTGTATFQVKVTYAWGAFLPPISLDGRAAFKIGSTIPVKFALGGVSAGITNAVAKLYVARVSSQAIGDELQPATTMVGDLGNQFRYDGASYIFNWSTKGQPIGTWVLYVDLGDGAAREVRTITISTK